MTMKSGPKITKIESQHLKSEGVAPGAVYAWEDGVSLENEPLTPEDVPQKHLFRRFHKRGHYFAIMVMIIASLLLLATLTLRDDANDLQKTSSPEVDKLQ